MLHYYHMQTWFLVALIAPAVWAIGNLIDVYLVKTYLPNNSQQEHSLGSLVLVSCLVGLLFLPIIALFQPQVFTIPINHMLFLGLVGIVEGGAILAYLYALHHGDDASSVITWFNSIPVFALILGFVFLKETITQNQIIGFIIVLIGLLLVSIQKNELGIVLKKKVVLFMVLSSIGYAIMTLLFKIGALQESFWIASFWQYVGLTVLGIILFIFVAPYRNAFLQLFKNKGISFYGINLTNELLFVAGTMIANFAALLGPIALVALAGSFQPLWVIGLGSIASLILPAYFDNELDIPKKELLLKIIGILLTLTGLWFI